VERSFFLQIGDKSSLEIRDRRSGTFVLLRIGGGKSSLEAFWISLGSDLSFFLQIGGADLSDRRSGSLDFK
ncbi:17370_t:CDS:2, partial [Funneliformis caledonium]